MRGMILAAGFGVRLRPLTHILPKPLLPIANIPTISYALAMLRSWGVEGAAVNAHHMREKVTAYLEGSGQEGSEIASSPEEELFGTAGGIKRMEHFLRGSTFAVANADILTDMKLEEALRLHREKGALATMILRENEDEGRFGVIGMNHEGRIKRFLSTWGTEEGSPLRRLMYTGIQILEPEFLDHIPQGRHCNISEEVYPALIRKGAPIFGYVYDGYWIDIGSPADYHRANMDVIYGRVSLPTLQPGPRISGASERGAVPPVALAEGLRLGMGARIGPGSAAGPGCIVGDGSRLEECVLWDGVRVGKNARLRRAIIPSGAKR